MRAIVIAGVIALLAQGCGDAARVPTFQSGVPPERPLLGQSPEEEQAFCEEAMRYIDALYPLELAQRGECMTGALVLGLIRGEPACETEMTRCLAEAEDMTDHLAQALSGIAEQGTPAAILACDCVLRRMEAQEKQLSGRISDLFRAHRVIGFSTYVEQLNGMHVNQTLTGVALYPPPPGTAGTPT